MTYHNSRSTRRASLLRLVAIASLAIGCDATDKSGPSAVASYDGTDLAVRQFAVDTSRFTARYRSAGGGGVFITLTGEPSPLALTQLQALGATPAVGKSRLITFDNLRIATVYANLPAADVERIAQLPFVVRIESSDDVDFITGNSFSPAINTTASDIAWNLLRVRAPDIWRDFAAAGQKEIGPGQWDQVYVAVLDEGGDCRQRYPSANWQFFAADCGPNFTTDPTAVYLGQHGTDVGSFVAGEPDNLWGAGVAPRVAVNFIKVLPAGSDWGPVVQGLDDAYDHGYSVINMSLGNCGEVPPSTVQTAISRFTSRVPADAANPGVGVSLVAAAGNGTFNGCPGTAVSYPAAYSEVIGVAAIDESNGTWTGLAVGPDIELSAPGLCVDGLLVGGGAHPCISGTSFASPHVAGLIGIIRAQNPSWSAAEVRQRLISTATKIAGQALPRDNRFGYGIVNAYAVLSPPSAEPLTVTITGPSTVRTNRPCMYDANASGGTPPLTYAWSPGGQTEASITMSFSSSQTLSVTVTDALGQTAFKSKNITVSPTAPICPF